MAQVYAFYAQDILTTHPAIYSFYQGSRANQASIIQFARVDFRFILFIFFLNFFIDFPIN